MESHSVQSEAGFRSELKNGEWSIGSPLKGLFPFKGKRGLALSVVELEEHEEEVKAEMQATIHAFKRLMIRGLTLQRYERGSIGFRRPQLVWRLPSNVGPRLRWMQVVEGGHLEGLTQMQLDGIQRLAAKVAQLNAAIDLLRANRAVLRDLLAELDGMEGG